MTSLVIEDFKAGLDHRKSILTAPPGALYTASNVHISRGGEIEKRRAFVPYYALPAGSAGLTSNSVTMFTFSAGAHAFLLPNLENIQVVDPHGGNLVSIIGTTMFRGRPYCIALFDNGLIQHFYDGTYIAAWDSGGAYEGYAAAGCVTLGSKIYVVANTSMICCENDSPLNWGTNINGSAIFDLSTNYGGAEALTGIGIYINRLAIYSRYNVQIFVADPDPEKTALLQVLPTLGTIAARSVVPFGDTDNFMLSQTGVRSLRARDMSLTAGIYDIGTPIDPIINDFVAGLDAATIAAGQAIVEPVDGRYMLAIGSAVYVFSYFPVSHVSAWTTYDLGGAVTGWAIIGPSLFARIGNGVFQFGGASQNEYDGSAVEVVLPYLSAGSPSVIKQVSGFDMAMTGQWQVELGLEPNPPYTKEVIGRFDHETFGMGRVDVVGQGTHFGVRLTSTDTGPATVGNMILSYTGGEDT